jgi:transcriptional regulator with XRE-family HTH domain
MLSGMDNVRLGLSIRALRRRRGWTQADLAARTGLTRSAIGRIERGEVGRARVDDLERITEALGARLLLRVLWHGEELDRLLDSEHARLVEWVVTWLARLGWEANPEVTFALRGERGSIDVFAYHKPTRTRLIVEVKSVVPDAQSTLSGLDRKSRLGREIARQRGLAVDRVARLLVLPADRTARRRVEQLKSTFGAAFPDRTAAVRRWVASPTRELAGILFVPNVTATSARHRIRRGAVGGERLARSGIARERSRAAR